MGSIIYYCISSFYIQLSSCLAISDVRCAWRILLSWDNASYIQSTRFITFSHYWIHTEEYLFSSYTPTFQFLKASDFHILIWFQHQSTSWFQPMDFLHLPFLHRVSHLISLAISVGQQASNCTYITFINHYSLFT